MAKKRPPYNENASFRGALRRVFARSPIVQEVKNEGRRDVPKYNKDGSRSKKDAVQYSCQVCNEWVASKMISVDHIVPVISEDGFEDWNTFVARLSCEKKNLQRICDDCHQIKTNQERWVRILKNAWETLPQIQELEGEALKKALQKYSPKKLDLYPADFRIQILLLKEKIKKKK